MAGYHKGTHFQSPDPLQRESVNRVTRYRMRKKRKASQHEEPGEEPTEIGSLGEESNLEADNNLYLRSSDEETNMHFVVLVIATQIQAVVLHC